jgi:ATP-dependent helicase/nuclease subunit B
MQQKDLRKHPEGEWTFVDRGLLIESDRFGNAPFGSHDAVLRDDKALAQLSETFGSDHLFSVNQIETYRNCPFHFFAHRVLRLEEEEAPVAEFDPRVRGTILHDALQAFHEHYRGVPVPEIPEIEGLQTLHGKLAKAFEQEAWKSVAAPDAVLRAERAYLTSLVSAYFNLERARKNADMWCPEHFEIIFGPGRRGEDSNDPDPFVLETDEGPVQFTGRIDRVDSADGGTGKVHRLVDYKTGSMPQVKDIESGYNIQLVLYALATEQALFPGDACEEALYLHIGKSKAVEALSKNPTRGEPKWEVRRNAAIEGVAAALRGIRSGWFPPQRHGQTCYGCGQARACRYNQRRITRKQSDNESNGPAS